MIDRLHAELWTSWASLLRSYAAAHGLNSVHHAIVEVGADEVIVRVNDNWLRFSASEMERQGDVTVAFTIREDGNVSIDNGPPEEMDFAAERLVREMLHGIR